MQGLKYVGTLGKIKAIVQEDNRGDILSELHVGGREVAIVADAEVTKVELCVDGNVVCWLDLRTGEYRSYTNFLRPED